MTATTKPTAGESSPPPTLAPYTQQAIRFCPDGHPYPAMAGECPDPAHRTRAQERRALGETIPPGVKLDPLPRAGTVAPEVMTYMNRFVIWVDNGKAPRSNYSYDQWDYAKAGTVNHIPVCDTLAQLTAYFNSGTALGSTHFGNGRDHFGDHEAYGYRFPCSEVHQYMTTAGAYSPWAQGIIDVPGRCPDPPHPTGCPIPPSPTIKSMGSGEPNCAFVSIENVARSGADGVTDAQFNSNVMLRVYAAQYYQHEITPLTQLWHAEIDQHNRCFDPGWPGALEDEMQAAANAIMRGDASLMRAAVLIAPPGPEPIPPEPNPYRSRYIMELRAELAAYQDDAMQAAVRIDRVTRDLAAEGEPPVPFPP